MLFRVGVALVADRPLLRLCGFLRITCGCRVAASLLSLNGGCLLWRRPGERICLVPNTQLTCYFGCPPPFVTQVRLPPCRFRMLGSRFATFSEDRSPMLLFDDNSFVGQSEVVTFCRRVLELAGVCVGAGFQVVHSFTYPLPLEPRLTCEAVFGHTRNVVTLRWFFGVCAQ